MAYTGLANDTYTFYVRAVDKDENVHPSPASFTFTVDTVQPVAAIIEPAGGFDRFSDLVLGLMGKGGGIIKGVRPLSNDEILLVLQQFSGTYAIRNRSLFMLGVSVGGRISELLALTIEDVSQNGQPVKDLLFQKDIVKGKETARMVPVNVDGRKAISDLKKFDAGKRHFTSIAFSRIMNALDRLHKTQSTQAMEDNFTARRDTDMNELESSYANIRYFVWLIPTLGFIGTVLGIGQGIAGFAGVIQQVQDFTELKKYLPNVTTASAWPSTRRSLRFY